MTRAASPLTEDDERRARRVISAWHADPRGRYDCPVCLAPGVGIEDCSARPHTEWYHIHCAACGLDHMLTIPLGSRPPSLD